jgi:predicted HicB family RNase H-like nuclease
MAFKDKADAVKYVNDYKRQAYDRINLIVPKGDKAKLQEQAAQAGKSLNQFIVDKVYDKD